jgi:hypothetical protein
MTDDTGKSTLVTHDHLRAGNCVMIFSFYAKMLIGLKEFEFRSKNGDVAAY